MDLEKQLKIIIKNLFEILLTGNNFDLTAAAADLEKVNSFYSTLSLFLEIVNVI